MNGNKRSIYTICHYFYNRFTTVLTAGSTCKIELFYTHACNAENDTIKTDFKCYRYSPAEPAVLGCQHKQPAELPGLRRTLCAEIAIPRSDPVFK